MTKKLTLLLLAITVLFVIVCGKELMIQEQGNLVPETAEFDPPLPAITLIGTMLAF